MRASLTTTKTAAASNADTPTTSTVVRRAGADINSLGSNGDRPFLVDHYMRLTVHRAGRTVRAHPCRDPDLGVQLAGYPGAKQLTAALPLQTSPFGRNVLLRRRARDRRGRTAVHHRAP